MIIMLNRSRAFEVMLNRVCRMLIKQLHNNIVILNNYSNRDTKLNIHFAVKVLYLYL